MANLNNLGRSAWHWLPALLLLGGCCANNVCDCPGEDGADAVRVVFDPATFGPTDLDTLVLQRYPKARSRNVRPDVVTLVRPAARAYDTLVIDNNTPFARQATTKLNAYGYQVRYLRRAPGQRPNAALALQLDSVQLRGSYEGNGCCTCYQNTYKALFYRTAQDSSSTGTRTVVLGPAGSLKVAK